MHAIRVLALSLLVVLTACGSAGDGLDTSNVTISDDSSEAESTEGDDSGGNVADQQPPGQAMVSVDGLEFTLTEPGALACTITDESITFSFRIGDNEVTLGAGANRYDDWLGSVDLRVANPKGEDGPVGYFPDLAANSDAVAIAGSSFSYSGPMLKQPANDGSNPPPIEVGDGIITATCP